ncbi:MAG: LytR C-terminal domain-containing protein [Calditrichaeota bacterium]|nr:LytR C-terminal domain-containing protein [Calditrichota bacterium]MCB9277267.1 LytR C-terminal domain-containing protein [Lewinellaceae bacterium]
MENNDTQQQFAETARLLNELQKQLMRYKTALDSIDGASEATQNAAAEIAKLSAIFTELTRAQAGLQKSFEDTRRVLLTTQQKAEQLRRDLDQLGKSFADNMNASMRGKASDFDSKFERAFLAYNKSIGQEIQRLKVFMIANVGLIFILLLLTFFFRGGSSSGTKEPSRPIAEQGLDAQLEDADDGSDLEAPNLPPAATEDEPAGTTTPPPLMLTDTNIKIQILNGCGVPKVADRFKSFLEGKSFKVGKTDNADNFNYTNTLIYVNGNFFNQARAIAEELRIDPSNISPGDLKWNNYDITIVLGKNYESLAPYR